MPSKPPPMILFSILLHRGSFLLFSLYFASFRIRYFRFHDMISPPFCLHFRLPPEGASKISPLISSYIFHIIFFPPIWEFYILIYFRVTIARRYYHPFVSATPRTGHRLRYYERGKTEKQIYSFLNASCLYFYLFTIFMPCTRHISLSGHWFSALIYFYFYLRPPFTKYFTKVISATRWIASSRRQPPAISFRCFWFLW